MKLRQNIDLDSITDKVIPRINLEILHNRANTLMERIQFGNSTLLTMPVQQSPRNIENQKSLKYLKGIQQPNQPNDTLNILKIQALSRPMQSPVQIPTQNYHIAYRNQSKPVVEGIDIEQPKLVLNAQKVNQHQKASRNIINRQKKASITNIEPWSSTSIIHRKQAALSKFENRLKLDRI